MYQCYKNDPGITWKHDQRYFIWGDFDRRRSPYWAATRTYSNSLPFCFMYRKLSYRMLTFAWPSKSFVGFFEISFLLTFRFNITRIPAGVGTVSKSYTRIMNLLHAREQFLIKHWHDEWVAEADPGFSSTWGLCHGAPCFPPTRASPCKRRAPVPVRGALLRPYGAFMQKSGASMRKVCDAYRVAYMRKKGACET